MSEQRNIKRFSGVDNVEEMEATPIKLTTITTINYDCLEQIFDLLDLKNLLIVAKTCKRLQIAAAANFGDRFGGKMVRIRNFGKRIGIIIKANRINVSNWEMILPFLRCFGSKIMHLKVGDRSFYCHDEERNHLMHQYISEYCTNSLKHIAIVGKVPDFNMLKPLENVGIAAILFAKIDYSNQKRNL